MNRPLKIFAGIVAAVIVALLLILTTFNWNLVKPWFEETASVATQRTFSIDGDLTLSWQRPAHEQGWRRWVPWPHFRAQDVVLGNTEWATTGKEMAHIAQIDFVINPLSLLRKNIAVQSLIMTEPRLALEQDRKGQNNWTFPPRESSSKWHIEIKDVATTKGTIRYVDAVKQADMQLRVDTLPDNSVMWKLTGKFNDEAVAGNAKTGALLSIQATDVPYPLEAQVVVGATTILVKGTLTDPAHPSAIDANLKVVGGSMADLFPLSGVLLPETPKFSTQGRVVGTFGRGNLRLRYEKFTGKVGASDIGGTLEYVQSKPRPLLRGKVVSNRLNLNDLIALLGAGEGPKKQKAHEVKQPADKIIPVAPFKTQRWGKMDADVQFDGEEIIRAKNLPIENVHTHLRMQDGVLSLVPLNFGIAGGKLAMELIIDGRSDPAKANMKVSARNWKLKALFPGVEAMHSSLGEIHGDAKISATGNSFTALAATSNGEVLALMSHGTVSEFVMESIGLNVGRVVVSKLFGDRQVRLNCMAADFGIAGGVMRPHIFIVDTDDAVIRMAGEINLARETIDLKVSPQSKGLRLLSLRSPLYLRGTFKKPEVGVDKAALGLKAGGAVVLGIVASPLIALLALTQANAAQDSPCAALLQQVKKQPVAPRAGMTAR